MDKNELNEEWLYRTVWEIFQGNGSVRFDSDRMDKHDEDWVRHVARNLARRIAAGKQPSNAFWEKPPVEPPITVEQLLDLYDAVKLAPEGDRADYSEAYSDATVDATQDVYGRFMSIRNAGIMMRNLSPEEIAIAVQRSTADD